MSKERMGTAVSVRLPEELASRLAAVAVAEDRAIAALIRRAVEAYVTASEKENG